MLRLNNLFGVDMVFASGPFKVFVFAVVVPERSHRVSSAKRLFSITITNS